MNEYKEYKIQAKLRNLMLVLGIVVIVIFAWVGISPFLSETTYPWEKWLSVFISVVVIIGFLSMLFRILILSLKVYSDKFVQPSMFGKKEYLFTDIKGFRSIDNEFIVLEHKDKKKPSLKISKYFENIHELLEFISRNFNNLNV